MPANTPYPKQTPRAAPPTTASRSTRTARTKGHPDIRQTKEYKLAARRWTATIVALPIVMYTSWILYERIYGNKSPKKLPMQKQPQQEQSPSSS